MEEPWGHGDRENDRLTLMWAISAEGPVVLARFSADVSPAAGVTGEVNAGGGQRGEGEARR